jgi:hypothetical protein
MDTTLSPKDLNRMEGINRFVTSDRSEISPVGIKQTNMKTANDSERKLVMICNKIYVW